MPLFSSIVRQDQKQGYEAFAHCWAGPNIGFSPAYEYWAPCVSKLKKGTATKYKCRIRQEMPLNQAYNDFVK